jgi:hypothetical protein
MIKKIVFKDENVSVGGNLHEIYELSQIVKVFQSHLMRTIFFHLTLNCANKYTFSIIIYV